MWCYQLTMLVGALEKVTMQLQEHTQGMDVPGTSWKSDFENLAACMAAAETSIAQLKGGVISRDIQDLEKAGQSFGKVVALRVLACVCKPCCGSARPWDIRFPSPSQRAT